MREEASVVLDASAEAVFALLDDQAKLAEHMTSPSLMMGGGRMTYDFDAARGQAVGSVIRMGGSAFGIRLSVAEVITERVPPVRKVWRTVGAPHLLIIGPYEMGFSLRPQGPRCHLVVWINYEPATGLGRWVPWLAAYYARWCVRKMVEDADRRFGPSPAGRRDVRAIPAVAGEP